MEEEPTIDLEKNENAEKTPEPEKEEPKQWPGKPKKKKSVLRKILGWLVYIAIIVAMVYYTPKLLSEWLGTDSPIAAITSGSMWPALKKGDLVLVKAVKQDEIAVGDIVVYTNKQGFTIHRIIEIKGEKIITKGDANNISDTPIMFKDIVGKTLEWGSGKPIRIPEMGYISIWVNSKRNSK